MKTASKKAAPKKKGTKPPKIVIDPEFAAWLPEPTPEEEERLSRSIKAQGCRHPLIVWEHQGKAYLLDGHRRHRWCTKHKVAYEVEYLLQIRTREQALLWMIENQLERRNLAPLHASALRGKERNLHNPGPGKPRQIGEVGTREALAEKHGVSPRTIDRDSQLAHSLDVVNNVCGDGAQHKLLNAGLYRYEINSVAEQAAETQQALLETLGSDGAEAFRKDLKKACKGTDAFDVIAECGKVLAWNRAKLQVWPAAHWADLQDLYRRLAQIIDELRKRNEEGDVD